MEMAGVRCLIAECIDLAGLADFPVLAEPTREVTARGSKREHRCSGQEVIERLLLDRVDAVAARSPIAFEDDFTTPAGANKAQPPLPLLELTVARANVALNPIGAG